MFYTDKKHAFGMHWSMWQGVIDALGVSLGGAVTAKLLSLKTMNSFEGYNHAHMCFAKPEEYVANVKKFIHKT